MAVSSAKYQYHFSALDFVYFLFFSSISFLNPFSGSIPPDPRKLILRAHLRAAQVPLQGVSQVCLARTPSWPRSGSGAQELSLLGVCVKHVKVSSTRRGPCGTWTRWKSQLFSLNIAVSRWSSHTQFRRRCHRN